MPNLTKKQRCNLSTELSKLNGFFSLSLLSRAFDNCVIEGEKKYEYTFYFQPSTLPKIIYCSIVALLEKKEPINIIKKLELGIHFEGNHNENVGSAIELIDKKIKTKTQELRNNLSEEDESQYKLALLHSEEKVAEFWEKYLNQSE